MVVFSYRVTWKVVCLHAALLVELCVNVDSGWQDALQYH